jgi:putative ABC transport system substrate-binding protein
VRRRELLALLGGTAAAWPLVARAQQPGAMRRMGWLDIAPADDPTIGARRAAVKQELEKRGWTVGRNLQLDYREGAISGERAQRFGAELLGLEPDVILCGNTIAVKALQQQTKTVPLVFVLVAEPVAQGVVQSLAHPGANITGFAFLERTVGARWLQLLREIAPTIKRITYVYNPKASPYAHFYYESLETEAKKLSVATAFTAANEPADLESIVSQAGADAGLIFNPDGFINSNLQLAIDAAARHRVPAIYGTPLGAAQSGGLISYSVDLLALYRQAVTYIDRILKGEKPADLPVQQPTKFELEINLRTAKVLGLEVPLTLQAAADDLIE